MIFFNKLCSQLKNIRRFVLNGIEDKQASEEILPICTNEDHYILLRYNDNNKSNDNNNNNNDNNNNNNNNRNNRVLQSFFIENISFKFIRCLS